MMLAATTLAAVLLTGCADSSSIGSKSDSKPANSAPASYSTNSAANVSATPVPDMARRGEFEEKSTVGERYAQITENPFLEASRAPLSTFSIDVDTASYTKVRRMLNDGVTPPQDAVRIEEMINYFTYDYPQPTGDLPFSVSTDVAACPWNSRHKLLQIGLQGKKAALDNLPPSNLVFLLDVSGSMNSPDKLPLLKQGLRTLVGQLSPKDRVAIVVYAGASGLALPSTSAEDKSRIINALESLQSGGSTNGGAGIQLAYQVARENFIEGGNNRVILATDGDFNVGPSSDNELVALIEAKRRENVYLSVLGFGTGNLNDSMMEKLADKGNGNYGYIDSGEEASKALGRQVAGTLYAIAKDVKIQVEFNPAKVAGYRLIGYENRMLAAEDFNDDRKDAGEIGSGHTVTALYEVVPAGQKLENPGIDELRYGRVEASDTRFAGELATVKLRYKNPNSNESKLMSVGVLDQNRSFESAPDNLRFAAAVAGFGLMLRDSKYKGNLNFDTVKRIAAGSRGNDLGGERQEFLSLIDMAGRSRG